MVRRFGNVVRGVWAKVAQPVQGLCVVAGAFVMALMGPFGMYETAPFWERLVFWGMVAPIALCLAYLIEDLILGPEPVRSYGKAWGVGVVFAVVLTPVICGLVFLIWGAAVGWWAILAWTLGVVLPLVTVVQAFRAHGSTVVEAPCPVARFLAKVPGAEGAALICLRSDNHHLEVVTDQGVFRVRQRLSDAALVLQDAPGMQVHRSHWVMLSHVVEQRSDGRRMVLVLSDGREVAVGNRYRSAVEAAL